MARARLNRKPDAPYALTIAEFSERMRISVSAIYRMKDSGEIKMIKVAGRVLIPMREVERLLGGEAVA